MSLILSGTDGVADVDGSAATPAIRGTDANTGIYFPGADRIGFAEGGVQVGEFDASGNFLMNSGYGSAAVAYGCRAWVNFNGTFGSSPFTIANGGIRGAGNVSSVTDNGTGDYTVNFTTAMPDANYSAVTNTGGTGGVASSVAGDNLTARTTTVFRFFSLNTSGAGVDAANLSVAIFR